MWLESICTFIILRYRRYLLVFISYLLAFILKIVTNFLLLIPIINGCSFSIADKIFICLNFLCVKQSSYTF